ncbi:MAG: hypothetical protein U0L92_00575 [Clostridia bacterium]|nr:hypothetical protein [Clostridia bacterium]
MKFNKLLKKMCMLTVAIPMVLNVAATFSVSADTTDLPVNKTVVEENFDTQFWEGSTLKNTYTTNGTYTLLGQNFTTRSVNRSFSHVDEANGALSGKSIKLNNGTSTNSAQLRVYPGTSATGFPNTPMGCEFSFRFDNFGTGSDSTYLQLYTKKAFCIDTQGNVSTTATSTDVGKLELYKWYTAKVRYDLNARLYVYTITEADTGKVICDQIKAPYDSDVTTSSGYFNFYTFAGTVIYYDNVKIYTADASSGSAISADGSFRIQGNVYGRHANFKVLAGTAVTGEETVLLYKDGVQVENPFSWWNSAGDILKVSLDEPGNYQIYVLDLTDGTNTLDVGMEWTIREVGDAVFTEKDGAITVDVTAPKGSLVGGDYRVILAAYDGNNLKKAAVGDVVTAKSDNDTINKFTTEITEVDGYTVKAFLFKMDDLSPVWEEVQVYSPETAE